MWKIDWQIYLIGLCLGIIMITGFRSVTAVTVVGFILSFLALSGFGAKLYKFLKDVNER